MIWLVTKHGAQSALQKIYFHRRLLILRFNFIRLMWTVETFTFFSLSYSYTLARITVVPCTFLCDTEPKHSSFTIITNPRQAGECQQCTQNSGINESTKQVTACFPLQRLQQLNHSNLSVNIYKKRVIKKETQRASSHMSVGQPINT